jgi:hypothetical protein
MARISRRGAWVGAALVVVAASGCASPPPQRGPDSAIESANAPAGELYDIPEMKRAQQLRYLGFQELETAYSLENEAARERHLKRAFSFLEQAQIAYHDALPKAPERYRPVIERDIETVVARMHEVEHARPQQQVD